MTKRKPLNEIQHRTMQVRAVNEEKREVTGIAVPYDTPTDRAGWYTEVIEKGAVRAAPSVKFFRDHETPIGIVTSYRDTDEGWEITAKISETALGDETYTLLKDGVLDKMSIGFRPVEHRFNEDEEIIYRTEIEVLEVSVVPFPAYEEAQIGSVRAATSTKNDNKGEKEMDTSKEVAEVRATVEDLDRRVAVALAQIEENRTASEGTSVPFKRYGDYIKALAKGDEKAIRAFEGIVSGDLNPRNAWYGNLLELTRRRQPITDIFRRAVLPEQGNFLEYLKIKDNTLRVDRQAAEGDDLAYGKLNTELGTEIVRTYGGWTSMSRQAIERSNVNLVELAYEELLLKYANRIELANETKVVSAAEENGSYIPVTFTQDGVIDFILEAVDYFEAQGAVLSGFLVNTAAFKELYKVPANDRILQVNGAPTDRVGSVDLKGVRGNVANVDFLRANIFNPAGTDADPFMIAYDDTGLVTLESAGTPMRLFDDNVVNLTKEMSVYGYAAHLVPNVAKFKGFTKA